MKIERLKFPAPRRRDGKMICVTGGAGFLGSHLCERMVKAGNQVVCIDNFQTGSRANVARLIETGNLVLVKHDISRPFPPGLPVFDEIYNLACPASPRRYQADPVRTSLTCAHGAIHVLERAKRDGARVLHASTSEIYGDPDIHPQPESYWGNVNPVGPRSCYDEGKRFAETLMSDYGRQFGLSVNIARIFNTYGPRMQADDGRVVSNFINQALNDEPITIYGDGEQTRSFCFVDDLIEGLIRLMAKDGFGGAPVNLGNPHEVRVADLAAIVIAKTGSASQVVYWPCPVDDPRRRRPDISRARSLLDWSPQVALSDGLDKTIDFFAAASLKKLGKPTEDRAAPAALLPA